MFTVLVSMAAIIALGIIWRLLLGGNQAEKLRGSLAKAVYEVFLPALVLSVMWHTTVDLNVLRLPVVAALAVLVCLVAAAMVYGDGKRFGGRKAAGAMLLAAGFGNFTYLGLPVLTQAFGPWAQAVAIPFDLFASTPLLFTVGILIARYYGNAGQPVTIGLDLFKVPAMWAALGGLFLSLADVAMPPWLDETLGVLAAAVVPLMLLAVGMALSWRAGWLARLPVLVPALLIQLVFMPLVVWGACLGVGMPGNLLAPSVMEGAMPCMVLGLVICDRFKLDTSLYAEAVTVSTALSLLTLPLWLKLVQ